MRGTDNRKHGNRRIKKALSSPQRSPERKYKSVIQSGAVIKGEIKGKKGAPK